MEMGCASKSDSRRLSLRAKCIILPEIDNHFGDSVKSPTQVSFLNKGTRTIQWRATRGEVLSSEVVIGTGNTLTKVIIQWPCKKFQRIGRGTYEKEESTALLSAKPWPDPVRTALLPYGWWPSLGQLEEQILREDIINRKREWTLWLTSGYIFFFSIQN